MLTQQFGLFVAMLLTNYQPAQQIQNLRTKMSNLIGTIAGDVGTIRSKVASGVDVKLFVPNNIAWAAQEITIRPGQSVGIIGLCTDLCLLDASYRSSHFLVNAGGGLLLQGVQLHQGSTFKSGGAVHVTGTGKSTRGRNATSLFAVHLDQSCIYIHIHI